MDSKKLKKLIRVVYILFNLSCISSIVEIYFRIFPGLHKLLLVKHKNFMIEIPIMPVIPVILVIITCIVVSVCIRRLYKLIISKV